MKLRNIILMTASVAMTACSKQAVPTAIPEDAKIEQQVEELLSKMDLDAKIGQMTELAIDVLGETINGEFQLDEAKLHKAIAEYKVGSFLNAPGQMPRGLFAELPARVLPPRDQRTDGDCAEHGRKPYLPCPEATAGKIVEIGADSAAVFHFFTK